MNNHSKLFAGALAVAAFLAVGCGGGDDGGGAANKGEWDEKYGAVVKSVSDDIDRSVQALNAGQRPVVLSECTQLQEDLVDAKKAVPVPDATVDAALRSAFDATTTAVATCVEGARIASDADKIEQAQAEMKTAREKYTKAQDAIAAWS
jgi:cobalamin biosynthesis protein CobT